MTRATPRARALRLALVACPTDGGVPRHVIDLVAALDPEEYDTVVACPPESPTWAGLTGSHARLVPIAGGHRGALTDAGTLRRLRGLVHGADIVHAHSTAAGALARLLCRIARRHDRCVFSPHAWSFWAAHGARRTGLVQAERWAARWTAALIAVSDAEMRAGLGAGIGRAEQYATILNGVDVSRFAPGAPGADGSVICVGRLVRQKRHDLVVGAFARLHARHPRTTLTIVGDGPERGSIAADVRRRGLGSAVTLLGERDDVPALLARAGCLLLASDYEGCPISVMEAMASGVPVVATDAGGTAELVVDGRTGILAPRGHVAALADGLERIVSAPVAAARIREAAREVAVRRFGHERVAAETAAVYRAVAGAARSRRGTDRWPGS